MVECGSHCDIEANIDFIVQSKERLDQSPSYYIFKLEIV